MDVLVIIATDHPSPSSRSGFRCNWIEYCIGKRNSKGKLNNYGVI